MIPPLLATRRFLPLFLTQFLGAFNDNVFKNALVMLIMYKAATQEEGQAQLLVTLAAGLFILPYWLFSATAGQLADKYDRAWLTRWIKVAEIAIMVTAIAGLYLNATGFLLFVLFCLGAQSTFFGPIKYALLPQHLRENELITGNAYIEAGTFLAILTGTILGGLLILQPGGVFLISATVLACALLGYLASRFIPAAPAPMPSLILDWNIARATWQIIERDRTNRRVFLSIIGISWFWLIGATFLSQFPTFAKENIGGDETVVTLFLTLFSIGIGIGSFLCNALLKGEVKSTYVPWGAAGISLFTLDLFFASKAFLGGGNAGALIGWLEFLSHAASWRVMVDLFAIAICGGLYIVPLYAIMQHDSDPLYRARTIASNNVLNALFMVVAAVGTMAMLKASFGVPEVFLTVAVLNVPVVAYILRLRRGRA